jgi:hypothetical protein
MEAGKAAGFEPCHLQGLSSKGSGGSFMHQPYRPMLAANQGGSLSASISSISCQRGSHLPTPNKFPRGHVR